MLILLLACPGELLDSGDCGTLLYRDDDLDGFGVESSWAVACPAEGWAADAGDCDDEDPTESPGAQAPCSCLGEGIERSWFPDDDGDGYGSGEPVDQCAMPVGHVIDSGDCAPEDPEVHPGAEETWYDGVDQDCDGASDFDADADGYESSAHGGDDCDDEDAEVNPDALELCDALRVDEDCDGLSNEDDPDARDYRRWYPDGDGDGHGIDGETVIACSPPEGYAGDNDDCDDTDPGISPSAEEICGNGVDEDCDVSLVCGPRGVVDLAWAEHSWTSETNLRTAAGIGAGDVDDDGVIEIVIGSPYASNTDGGYDGGVWVVDSDAPGLVEDGAWLGGPFESYAGTTLDVADVDGDGVDDLLVGQPGLEGSAVLLLGPVAGPLTASASLQLEGRLGQSIGFPSDVVIVDDVDGDALRDLCVSEQYSSWTVSYQGEVHLFSGVETGSTDVYDSYASVGGPNANDRLARCTVGDLDGDGVGEWVIGAPFASRGSSGSGTVYVLEPGAGGTLESSDGLELQGNWYSGALGWALAIDDLDDDGHAELYISEYGYTGAATEQGRILVIDALVEESGWAEDAAVARLFGDDRYDYTGYALQSPGDLDGDGARDLAVSAPWADIDMYAQGVVCLATGGFEGSLSLSDIAWAQLEGSESSDMAGVRLATVADVTGDGLPELLVQSPQGSGFGLVQIVPGGPGE